MTERDLSTMLKLEADAIDVPWPSASRTLTRGRRRVRARRARNGAGILVAAALAVTGIQLTRAGSHDTPDSGVYIARDDAPAAAGTAPVDWAVASGSQVQLDTGALVDLQAAVKSVYYTSAGLLLRVGRGAETDAPDSAYRLVTGDGDVTDLGLRLGDRVPGTDPEEPWIAWSEATDDPNVWDVVVLDVRTSTEVRRSQVEGTFTWGGWVAPPVALSNGEAYVGLDDRTVAVAVSTGSTRDTPLPGSTMPTVRGDHETVGGFGQVNEVVDAGSGRVLLTVPDSQGALVLSSDGRIALDRPYLMCDESDVCTPEHSTARVWDLSTGTSDTVELGEQFGWTAAGELLRVGARSVTSCVLGGACTSVPMRVGAADLRLGGSIYES